MAATDLRASGQLRSWTLILPIVIGLLVYFLITDDLIAGLTGFAVGVLAVFANTKTFSARWTPDSATYNDKKRLILTTKLLLVVGGLVLLLMAQIAPDLVYARWTPTQGWYTRSGGENSHSLITYFGGSVVGIGIALPFRLKEPK